VKHSNLAIAIAALAVVTIACASTPNTTPSPVPTVTAAPAPAPTPSPSPVAATPTTIHVLEDPIDFTDVRVHSLTGCAGVAACLGDQLIGRSRMLDATTRAAVGTLIVVCVLVDPAQNLYSCPANTIILNGRGQIVYTETLLFKDAPRSDWEKWAPWPIIGGTGEFLGATGTIDTPAESTWDYGDFVITIAN